MESGVAGEPKGPVESTANYANFSQSTEGEGCTPAGCFDIPERCALTEKCRASGVADEPKGPDELEAPVNVLLISHDGSDPWCVALQQRLPKGGLHMALGGQSLASSGGAVHGLSLPKDTVGAEKPTY